MGIKILAPIFSTCTWNGYWNISPRSSENLQNMLSLLELSLTLVDQILQKNMSITMLVICFALFIITWNHILYRDMCVHMVPNGHVLLGHIFINGPKWQWYHELSWGQSGHIFPTNIKPFYRLHFRFLWWNTLFLVVSSTRIDIKMIPAKM